MEMEKTISMAILDVMSRFFNKHEMGSGIWYPDDYHKYLNKCDEEMPASFFSGHANEEFFEKTSPYAFILKEGKKSI